MFLLFAFIMSVPCWIAIFARNFGRSLRTISCIVKHTRHLFFLYLEPFSSHPEYYFSFVKPL